MIKKIKEVKSGVSFDDEVELNWSDLQKPNMSGKTKKGVEFLFKSSTHLHANDVLECEDGYKICVKFQKNTLWEFYCDDSLEFAKLAYQIGNRHQPIMIEKGKITTLDDISLNDIINQKNALIRVEKTEGIFKPNEKEHHSH